MNTAIVVGLVGLAMVGKVGPLVAETLPEVTGTVGDIGTLGIGGYLLVQFGRLTNRVSAWLDALDKHHAAVRTHHKRLGRKLSELVAILRRAHGIPDADVVDLTPLPEDVDEVSPGRRRGVEPG